MVEPSIMIAVSRKLPDNTFYRAYTNGTALPTGSTVGSVLDGLLSGYVEEQAAEWGAGELIKKKPNQQ